MTSYDESRTAREIGERALILGFIFACFRLRGQEERSYAALVSTAKSALSASDQELFDQGHWSEALQRDLLWQMECLHVLLWSVNKLPSVPRVDQMVDPADIIAEINRMGRDPEGWLGALERRAQGELDVLDELLSFWRGRVRSRAKAGSRILPPFVKEAVDSALDRGVLGPDDIAGGDVVACGAPFFELEREQQDRVQSIVSERSRAVSWFWKDFDDWWAPSAP